MDIATILGLLIGLIAIGVGMVLKGVSLTALVNPAAILIIILGTIGAVMIAFPTSTIRKVPSYFRIVFTQQKLKSYKELIQQFSEWSDLTRKEGLLALENEIEPIEDDFLRTGMQLMLDGQETEYIKEVLLKKIEAMEERHEEGAGVFTQAGTYAPTLGVLGAVVGLIAALADMSDTDALGYAISAAFVATLLGIFTGYVLWHPFANKLREKSNKEVLQKQLIIEGVVSIALGQSKAMIEEKLNAFLSSKELAKLKQEKSYE
ncbi:flagellar motor protein MotA [Bacilli bacterium]|uniref:flagellar motor stator protein MotA n=1 Tax=Oceanobacillus TaxID=182709 RepID=UPI0006227E25|nr:flagellar motor protein MotA [Bacilli bacterium VT-13-104]PZD84853.1 flagellar motor protein MotA [Bacilli bacterium]PZD86376.1 flagellar motor protein MotA [Bacilli bacterium]PZD89834.1 flagellar motor protein MotA [Bacilli bacterium]RCO05344.1 flagellar motor protein MotA [Bacilli bacterium]